jgi:hypothetical protein
MHDDVSVCVEKDLRSRVSFRFGSWLPRVEDSDERANGTNDFVVLSLSHRPSSLTCRVASDESFLHLPYAAPQSYQARTSACPVSILLGSGNAPSVLLRIVTSTS